MKNPAIIYKTALAAFKNKQLLMVRSAKNKHAFYMLGGKVEAGELELESLEREVFEEASCAIKPGTIRFLKEFEAPAYGKENTLVNIKLYTGELDGEPKPSTEIVEIQYFDSTIDDIHVTPISREIIGWLKAKDLVA